MRIGWWLLPSALISSAYGSPPISTKIESSWPAPNLVTQYLETFSLEQPNHFFPFLSFLSSHPTSYKSVRPPLKTSSISNLEPYSNESINAVFTPEGTIRSNETLAVLRENLKRSLLLRDAGGKASWESLELSLSLRETSVVIEGMRGVYQEAKKVVEFMSEEKGEECESWIEVGGKAVCSEDEFWKVVGVEQRRGKKPIEIPLSSSPASQTRPRLYPFDHLSPSTRSSHLPLVIFYGNPASPSFQTLFTFLYQLSAPKPVAPPSSTTTSLGEGGGGEKKNEVKKKNTRAPHPPRLQFALRWKPASTSTTTLTTDEEKGHEEEEEEKEKVEEDKLVLSGYGAILDIKNSDYIVIDDRLSSSTGKRHGESNTSDDIKEKVGEMEGGEEVETRIEKVNKEDISDLSLRSTEYILSSTTPFQTFTSLTSSFPLYASKLSNLIPNVSSSLISEVTSNQINQLQTSTTRRHGGPQFYLNGVPLSEDQVDPFVLVRKMRKERKFVQDLIRLDRGLSSKDAREILINGGTKKLRTGKQGDGEEKNKRLEGMIPVEALGELFDTTDREEGFGSVVVWWNDLEKDSRYKSWPNQVKDLLRPTYPGSLNLVSKNLNNVIFTLDLTKPESLRLLTQHLRQFISRGIPMRFGIVPLLNSFSVKEEGEGEGEGEGGDNVRTEMAKIMWYLVESLGRGPTIKFFSELLNESPTAPITPTLLRNAYTRLFLQSIDLEGERLATFESIMTVNERLKEKLNGTRNWLKRLGIEEGGRDGDSGTRMGSFFLNGAYFPIDDDFSQNLQQTLGLHLQFLQQEVYLEHLTDLDDAQFYFSDLPSTYKRRNPYIFTTSTATTASSKDVGIDQGGKEIKVVDLLDAYNGVMPKFIENFFLEGSTNEIDEKTGEDVEGPAATVTMTIVTDLNEVAGIALVKSALELIDSDTSVRISLLHNPVEHYEAHPWTLSNIFYLLHRYESLGEVLPRELIDWIDLDLTVGGPLPRHGRDWTVENPLRPMLKSGVEDVQSTEAQMFWEELQWLAFKLGFQPGQNGIVINGRVVGPFPDYAFGLADLKALVSYEVEKRIGPLVNAVQETDFDLKRLTRSQQSRLYNLASSIVQQAYLPDPTAGLFGSSSVERRRDYMSLGSNHSAVIGPNERGGLFEIAVIVDPATELAQRWAPIIETLASLDSVHLRLYLNPTLSLIELPIKRFYRYSFDSTLRFDEETGREIQPSIRFDGVPEDVLLTFGIDAQKSWLAFPRSSVHDLDNIRLRDIPDWSRSKGVEAVLELESIIVEGHARDLPSSKPPRGLQLELHRGASGRAEEIKVDTIVMANLGYFQFKANPGPWELAIRDGKSSEVYEIESIGGEGWKSPEVARSGDTLVVSTLEGLTLYPRFRRKSGHEFDDLLDESALASSKKQTTSHGIFDRIKSMIPFLSTSTDLVSTGKSADINVFTVASGLLYERMAFLMVVSVMRHTKSSVKFWFIQNFLSPSFKAFIPHLAREYGFDYELVTYKWPHWLRPQTEKQRTIWGYKILFLDVLFPLELDRVIFVDSDQIVRADLKELIDLDLEGAPYAFAPMGNDREETKGYRFWEQGYWKQHLDGRPYHISALYVVDLDRFRQIAAGDRLRQQYQALTADPGSLANLDQDLPNNMQNTLPIKTLDRDWLWCETWCSDESLATAKTIDLCNNPKTKEQKLARARRLIPEWTVYDDEVAALARRVASEGGVSQSAIKSEGGGGGELAAFGSKADDLPQAVQQKQEREQVVLEERGRIKDEL